jgi:membrane-bound ClpP family serine protease
MEWITVASLIGIGLILIIIEVIFIPGTTFVGIAGFIFLIVGVAFSFNYFGREVGWLVFGGSAVLSGGLFYLAFRTNAWSRFALKLTMDSKVNEGDLDTFMVGQEGVTKSTLRPVGKAEINNKIVEVTTLGDYADSGTKVRIIKVLTNQIIVEPIN